MSIFPLLKRLAPPDSRYVQMRSCTFASIHIFVLPVVPSSPTPLDAPLPAPTPARPLPTHAHPFPNASRDSGCSRHCGDVSHVIHGMRIERGIGGTFCALFGPDPLPGPGPHLGGDRFLVLTKEIGL